MTKLDLSFADAFLEPNTSDPYAGWENEVSEEPQGTAQENDSWQITKGFKAGVDQVQAMGGGLTAAFGDALGVDSLKEWGLESYERNMAEAQENQGNVQGFTDIEGFGDAVDWALYTAGNMAPMLGTSLVGGGAGGLLAANLAKGAAQKIIAAEVAKGVAKKKAAEIAAKHIAKSAAIGAGLGAYAGSAGMETGNIYGEIQDLPGDNKAGVAFAHGAIAGALDAIPTMGILNRLGVGKVATEEIVDSVMQFAGKQIMKEGVTEGAQTIVEQHAKYWLDENQGMFEPHHWKEIIDASAAGALMGGVSGAGAGYMNKGKQPTPQTDEERVNAAKKAAAEQGGDALAQTIAGSEELAKPSPLESFGSNDAQKAEIEAIRQRRMDRLMNAQGNLDPEYFVRDKGLAPDPSQPVDFEATPITDAQPLNEPVQPIGNEIDYEAPESLALEPIQQEPIFENGLDFEPAQPQAFQPTRTDELAAGIEQRVRANDAAPDQPLLPAPDSIKLGGEVAPKPVDGFSGTGLDQVPENTGRMDSDPLQRNKERALAYDAEEKKRTKAARQARLPENLKDQRLLNPSYRGQLEKSAESLKQQAAKSKDVDAANDDLFSAIAKLGGINRDELASDGFDKEDMKGVRAGIKPVFSTKGRSADDMAEALIQDGYLSQRDPEELKERIRNQLAGNVQLSVSAQLNESSQLNTVIIQSAQELRMSTFGAVKALENALSGKKLTDKQLAVVNNAMEMINEDRGVQIPDLARSRKEKNTLRRAILDDAKRLDNFEYENQNAPEPEILDIDQVEFDPRENFSQDEMVVIEALLEAEEAGIPAEMTDELALRFEEPQQLASQIQSAIRARANNDRRQEGDLDAASPQENTVRRSEERSQAPIQEEAGRNTEIPQAEAKRTRQPDRTGQPAGETNGRLESELKRVLDSVDAKGADGLSAYDRQLAKTVETLAEKNDLGVRRAMREVEAELAEEGRGETLSQPLKDHLLAKSNDSKSNGQLEDNSEPLLSTYTEAELKQREEQKKAAADAEAQSIKETDEKQKADADVDSFDLTGSDRQADANPNQTDLLDAASESSNGQANNKTEFVELDEKPTNQDELFDSKLKAVSAGSAAKKSGEYYDFDVVPKEGKFSLVRKYKPTSEIKLSSDVQIEETGEVITIEDSAETLWRRSEKRGNTLQALLECVS